MLTLLLIIVVFDFVFDRVLDYLNASKFSTRLPESAAGIYDEEKYRKSQEYFKVNQRFSQYSSAFSFILLLSMLLLGGFGYLDTYLRQYTEDPVWITLLFFAVIAFASDILTLPFSIYRTFVIEEKFGFNKTSVKLFIIDKVKAYLLRYYLEVQLLQP